MDPSTFKDPQLPLPDQWVVDRLLEKQAVDDTSKTNLAIDRNPDSGYASEDTADSSRSSSLHEDSRPAQVDTEEPLQTHHESDVSTILHLRAHNDASSSSFEPTVFVTWDLHELKARLPAAVYNNIILPYISFAQSIVRNPTDVVFLTHLLLYFTTSAPSASYLFYNFTWIHAVLHLPYQLWLMGTYTLMMHQHIHQRGILKPSLGWFDAAFPYVLDPLMGHTWNTYYFHHVKHHHVEGNGPDDLSSTIRYERDNPWHLAHYIAHFIFTTWFELAQYFTGKRQYATAAKAMSSELGGLAFVGCMTAFVNVRAGIFVLVLPLMLMRLGLMVGNWGQHAFVDDEEPDSDFRSSITLIDVPSNRFCFNDGYHTSHHLNPRRHWRDHPVSFLNTLRKYEDEHALVFRNIDYIFLTIRLMRKDYDYLAQCMIPIGDQVNLNMKERAALLKRKTRPFSEEEIKLKFGKGV